MAFDPTPSPTAREAAEHAIHQHRPLLHAPAPQAPLPPRPADQMARIRANIDGAASGYVAMAVVKAAREHQSPHAVLDRLVGDHMQQAQAAQRAFDASAHRQEWGTEHARLHAAAAACYAADSPEAREHLRHATEHQAWVAQHADQHAMLADSCHGARDSLAAATRALAQCAPDRVRQPAPRVAVAVGMDR